MSYEVINLEGKRRKISRISVDDDIAQICEISNKKKEKQCGIIKRIILKNVFCHEHLDVDNFIPQLNLLQGANGSGKSSVVAGVIVGLGGTCKATERGKNISSIIKNGKNSASIEIHLSNDGYNPYQKEKFGNIIIVERKVTLSGSSSYKIKSEHGGIVSEKKEDLRKILEKFNIQVDNPALILSQERAKTFLSSTDPKQLFKFFMTSTQLKQWSDCIKEINEDLDSQKLLNSRKKESGEYLKKDIDESKKKIESMKSLEENNKKVTKLTHQKHWAEVQEKEMEKANLKKRLDKINGKLEKMQENITKATTEIKKLRDQKKSNDEKFVSLSEQSKSLDSKIEKAKARVNETRKNLRLRNNQREEKRKEKGERDKDVAILREKLEADNNEAKVRWEKSNEELKCKIEKLQKDSAANNRFIDSEKLLLSNIIISVNNAEEEFQHFEIQRKALVSRLESLKVESEGLKNQRENVTVFGSYMPKLLDEINRTAFKKEKPIGPLGTYINVKDKNWGHIVEKVISGVLSSFLVFCNEDFHLLKKIFDRTIPQRARKPRIIISPFRNRVHDVKRFETKTSQYFSMWSIIETNNVQVANTLLDQFQVESLLLIPDIENAMYIMSEKARVPQNCKKVMTLDGDTVFPDPDYRIYSDVSGERSVRLLQVSVQDRIEDLRKNLKCTEEEVNNCTKNTNFKSSYCIQLNAERKKSEDKIKKIEEQQRKIDRQIQLLKNSEEPAPPDVCHLQNDLIENEKLIEGVEKELINLNALVTEASNEAKEAEKMLKEVKENWEKIRTDLEIYKEDNERIEILLKKYAKQKNIFENEVTTFTKERNEFVDTLKDQELIIDKLIKDLTKNGEERVHVDKSKDEIEKELKNLKSAIEKRQATLGDMQTFNETLQKKLDNYSQLTKELSSQDRYFNEMNGSILRRSQSLHLAKKIYRAIMKLSFIQYITKRNLKGYMEIDFKAGTLNIMTCKDNGLKSPTYQSLQMLSGGERSFSTVSFVLALWDIVMSPIRIMDEFDVFMDIVSRKQCIDMITESVKETVQYIMVSPLECPIESTKVRILRLDPPERRSFSGSQENEEDE